MMLPNELVWVMETLEFEWPDIDEDEVRKGSVRGETGPGTLAAWNTNRSQNLQKLGDIMPPAAIAMDIGAEAIFALKMNVIVDVLRR